MPYWPFLTLAWHFLKFHLLISAITDRFQYLKPIVSFFLVLLSKILWLLRNFLLFSLVDLKLHFSLYSLLFAVSLDLIAIPLPIRKLALILLNHFHIFLPFLKRIFYLIPTIFYNCLENLNNFLVLKNSFFLIIIQNQLKIIALRYAHIQYD